MRILQIINSLYTGGAEKLLIDSIPVYKQKGIDMELLLLNGNETPFFQYLKAFGIKVHYLTKGNSKKIYNPLLIFLIIPYIKKYDVIHVHLFPALYWVALAKLLSFRPVKLIFTEHSTHNTRIEKGGIWRVLDKFIYRQYDKIVSITYDVNTIIKNHLSGNTNKFCVINNGIDLSRYTDSDIKYNPQEAITIIQVAGFREPKDQPTLIRSLQYLPDNIALFLVGDGETRHKCEQLVKELNLLNSIYFLGIRTDVPQLLKSSDIVVISSHWEGFGLAAVEGMAAGKPVIASDVPGLCDVVKGAGLLFSPGDDKILAEKINELLSDKQFYLKVAQNCSERAKQYDIDNMISKYIKLYYEVDK